MILLTKNAMKLLSILFITVILCSGFTSIEPIPDLIKNEIEAVNLQCFVKVKGTLRNEVSNEPLESVKLRIIDSTQQTIEVAWTNAKGVYSIELPCHQNYTVQFLKRGYNKGIGYIDLKITDVISEIEKDYYLKPLSTRPSLRSSRSFERFDEYVNRRPPSKDWRTTYINFATDRNYIQNNTGEKQFGNERGTLNYGSCMVTIPLDHRVGEIERPSWLRFEFSEDPEDHIVLQSVKVLDRTSFMKSIAHKMRKNPIKRSFVFIHGYNVSFQDAALRTAQMSYDLKFDGAPVFYSWPSQSNLSAYFKDSQNISWSEYNITEFLEDYIENSGADEIYLIAHSMGNRGLTKAIISVLSKKPELSQKIKEIILAAPDIDADIFKRDIAPQMVSLLKTPITLYVSSQDKALKASMEIHGEYRAGDSKDGIVVIDGIETIDASNIKTNFLGHSYYGDSSSIIGDLYDLIKSGNRANKRPKLKPVNLSEKVYWVVED